MILFSANLFAENKKILVLGFESEQLNDIQEVLLRNTLLRKLYENGFDIVPVMEVESIMIRDKGLQVVNLGKKDLKDYSSEVNSQYSMIGKIYPAGNKKLKGIKFGHQFVCDILLYQKKNNEFMNIKFNLVGKDNLFKFYSDITKRVISDIQKKIRK